VVVALRRLVEELRALLVDGVAPEDERPATSVLEIATLATYANWAVPVTWTSSAVENAEASSMSSAHVTAPVRNNPSATAPGLTSNAVGGVRYQYWLVSTSATQPQSAPAVSPPTNRRGDA
jgi:hypothetical protein